MARMPFRYLFFWKGQEEALFKKTTNGYHFFPYGRFGKGYEIEENKKADLTNFIRSYYAMATVLIVVLIVANASFENRVHGILVATLVAALLLLYYIARIRRLMKGSPRMSRRLSRRELNAAVAPTISRTRLIVVLVAGVIMLASSVLMFFLGLDSGDQESEIFGATGFFLFGYSFLNAVRIARLKKKPNALQRLGE